MKTYRLKQCSSIIDSALRHLIAGDVTGVCRSHRTGLEELKKLCRRESDRPATDDERCLDTLFDCAGLILGVCRSIASASGMPLSQRCELEVIREDLFGTVSPSKERLRLAADFVAHAIVCHLGAMNETGWDDGSHGWNYLRLLQNLRTAAACHSKLLYTESA